MTTNGWEVDPAALLATGAHGAAGAASLAGELLAGLHPDGSRPVTMRQGVVVSFSKATWTATITVAGNDTQVAGVPHSQAFPLKAGDAVWLAKYGPSYVIVGAPAAARRGHYRIQAGHVTGNFPNAEYAIASITFEEPYTHEPRVFGISVQDAWVVGTYTVSTTGAQLVVRTRDPGAVSWGYGLNWVAIGTQD